MIDTGLTTQTGGRIKRLQEFLGNNPFLLTYGDGLSNVDITKLVEFHNANKATVTVTGVRPSARFGELKLSADQVQNFQENHRSKMFGSTVGTLLLNLNSESIEGNITSLEHDL